MNSNLELLYISLILTFVFIIPFVGVAIYRQLKKYNIQKNDVLMGINISKVLINITENLLFEYGFNKDKVKLLTGIVLKTIDYLVINQADVSDEIKVKAGLEMCKGLLWEMEVVLSVDEEGIISDVISTGIKAVNCK